MDVEVGVQGEIYTSNNALLEMSENTGPNMNNSPDQESDGDSQSSKLPPNRSALVDTDDTPSRESSQKLKQNNEPAVWDFPEDWFSPLLASEIPQDVREIAVKKCNEEIASKSEKEWGKMNTPSFGMLNKGALKRMTTRSNTPPPIVQCPTEKTMDVVRTCREKVRDYSNTSSVADWKAAMGFHRDTRDEGENSQSDGRTEFFSRARRKVEELIHKQVEDFTAEEKEKIRNSGSIAEAQRPPTFLEKTEGMSDSRIDQNERLRLGRTKITRRQLRQIVANQPTLGPDGKLTLGAKIRLGVTLDHLMGFDEVDVH
jgi:hypothetical protein